MKHGSHKLLPICSRCEYRRLMAYNGYATNSNYLHGCLYILIEGEPRGCTPTENYCEKFKPRQKRKTIGKTHEMFK